ncbi:MAG: cytochrome c [Polaromonas sp.]|nr:cytochrome c [Polaromonas sp.]
MRRRFQALGMLALLAVAALAAAWLIWQLATRGDSGSEAAVAGELAAPASAGQPQIERGAYLARAGNCMGCHTARGGAPYAGGRPIETPFGAVFSSNLTPDMATGLGRWSVADFWRALHHGRSRDGRLLVPAFPYPNYTVVTRDDSDALFAFLQSLPAAAQANQAHSLRFPYGSQAALAIWRALYFEPAGDRPEPYAGPAPSAEAERGAYLVQGLGHCSACHGARNALGATERGLGLAGGLIPVQNWYAPALTLAHEAGVGRWPTDDIVALLQHGVSPQASVAGPMAEVVLGSTQYLSDADLRAMAAFLKTIETPGVSLPAVVRPAADGDRQRAAKLYEQHCAACHGADGGGVAKAYPALAGNRAVTMGQTVNLVQVVLHGGYPPATAGNPRPFGMPPFVLTLGNAEIAQVLTHIRQSWGNQASAVTAVEVNGIRANRGR